MMIHILNLFFFFNIGTVYHILLLCRLSGIYLNVFMHILNENTLILHSYNIIVRCKGNEEALKDYINFVLVLELVGV